MMKLDCPSSCMCVLTVCLQLQMECLDGGRVRPSRPGVAEGSWLAGLISHLTPSSLPLTAVCPAPTVFALLVNLCHTWRWSCTFASMQQTSIT